VDNEGPNEKSDGSGSVNIVDESSPEHPTPISPADPLPSAGEDAQQPWEKSSSPKGVETTPKKKNDDLTPSLEESSIGVPLPEVEHKSENTPILDVRVPRLSCSNTAIGTGNGYIEPENHADGKSLTDSQTDVWHSVPTTPMA
jgi:hypothetical protein